MRLAKFVAVLAAVAGPALAQPSANVIDVTPPADPAAVVVLRGSSAPPQPWGGPPASQPSSVPPSPAPTYVEQAYVPLYVLPGYFQAPAQRAPQHVPPAPQAAPTYPIRPWGVGLAPFQR
ncbi:MAG: hypothetical protein Q8N31_03500 [Reyranella sp.]|nr:hypothetical protein [Reyranella sp.]MDP3159056.1 hypothetical protein [Reyranella sp.]